MADAGGLRPLTAAAADPAQRTPDGGGIIAGGTAKRIPVEIRSQAWRRLWRAGRSEIRSQLAKLEPLVAP